MYVRLFIHSEPSRVLRPYLKGCNRKHTQCEVKHTYICVYMYVCIHIYAYVVITFDFDQKPLRTVARLALISK